MALSCRRVSGRSPSECRGHRCCAKIVPLGRGVNKSSEAATSLDALPNQQPLIHSDIGAPDDAAVVVVLLAKKRGKILPAKSSREETKLIELGFERRLLHRRAEPLCELGNDRSRRVRRRKQAP